MEKVNYNLEFCHIYVDEASDIEKSQSFNLKRTKLIVDNLKKMGKSFCLTTLIDNYTSENKTDFKIELFLEKLERLKLKPDFVVMESDMTAIAENLIEDIPDKWKRFTDNKLRFTTYLNDLSLKERRYLSTEDEDYALLFMKEKGLFSTSENSHDRNYDIYSDVTLKSTVDNTDKYSCSLLTACWHLFRLGIDKFTEPLSSVISCSEKPFFAERSITILPSQYLVIEANAFDILSFARTKAIKKARRRMEHVFH